MSEITEKDCVACGRQVETLRHQASTLTLELLEARETLARLSVWTDTYGAELCPGYHPDTFGEGMREAKQQVKSILTRRTG